MKRIVVFSITLIILVAGLSLGLTGCKPKTEAKAAESDGLAVGIVLPTKDEPRWLQDEARFKEALAKAGYSVEILFSQGDPARERSNVEALLAKGMKVLIICPHDGAAAASAADEAKRSGTDIISYDRLITGTTNVDYYVTFDSITVGKKFGQYLVDNAQGKGNNLYLYAGAATDNNAFLFFQGAWEILQPRIADGTFKIQNSSEAVALSGKKDLSREELGKIIGQVTTNWDFNVAKNLAEANLTSAPSSAKGKVYIAAPNDGTARAIADAFAADPEITKYYISGQDAEKASVQYIIDGKQSMTVFKDVRTLVKDAIAAAVAILEGTKPAASGAYDNGKTLVPAIQSEVITVTSDNVKSVLIDSGYYKASDFTGL